MSELAAVVFLTCVGAIFAGDAGDAVVPRGGGEALRRATRVGLVESLDLHGCDFNGGWVFLDGACQRVQFAAPPPELLPARASPGGFKFGVATSAYQIEGGAALGGRGPSIWDTFSHEPGRTTNGANGDVACDHYHRWREDLDLVAALGVDYYRMSIAWPRVMPDGLTLNPEGVRFYHELLDRLLELRIEPMVTLYHWDLPQALEDKGGWLNKSMIVPAFERYAAAMFAEYGAKVKKWSTFNEPATFVFIAYDLGILAPGRCSHRERCSVGDSLAEPLAVAHSVLVAHARAVRQLRLLSCAGCQCEGCTVGMVNCIKWTQPLNASSDADWQAAQWRMESELGIWTDPLYFGDYPASLVEAAGAKLLRFSDEEKALLRGSTDWFGLNLYTAQWASSRLERPNAADTGVMATSGAELNADEGDLIAQLLAESARTVGVPGPTGWLYAAPGALRNTLNWVADRYGRSTEILVTETGCAGPRESEAGLPLARLLDDQYRLSFLHEYMRAAAQARVLDGVNVTSFIVWSLLDNFEWAEGYQPRFGLVRVQYEDGLARLPKASYAWLQALIRTLKAGSAGAELAVPTLAAVAPPSGAASRLSDATAALLGVATLALVASTLVAVSRAVIARRATRSEPTISVRLLAQSDESMHSGGSLPSALEHKHAQDTPLNKFHIYAL